MTREELEHIIRASGDITDQYEFVIVGSQSILGAVPRPEDVFTVSMEADIYPLQAPEQADKIDGAIGEGSQFHETYGYYAQGVGPETACLPADWMQRVHRIQNRNTQDRIGYCLDVLDLFLAKAVAAREKDREFCIALLQYGYVSLEAALALVGDMPLMPRRSRRCGRRCDGGQKMRSESTEWGRSLPPAGRISTHEPSQTVAFFWPYAAVTSAATTSSPNSDGRYPFWRGRKKPSLFAQADPLVPRFHFIGFERSCPVMALTHICRSCAALRSPTADPS